eukprot:scaffold149946_cov31-Tisochrysis_lutea.AAC.1
MKVKTEGHSSAIKGKDGVQAPSMHTATTCSSPKPRMCLTMKFLMYTASFVAPEVSSAAKKYEPTGSDASALMMGLLWTFVQPSEMMVTPVISAKPCIFTRMLASSFASSAGSEREDAT